jgi:hypothetical protein
VALELELELGMDRKKKRKRKAEIQVFWPILNEFLTIGFCCGNE